MIADGGGPVGCAYGYPLARDSGWWRGLTGAVPEELEELTAAGKVFTVAEVTVLPRHRRQGIGRRLHDQLLAGSGAALGALALATPGTDGGAARAALRAWGWTPAGRFRPGAGGGPGAEVFTRPLRR
ncbi:GNAT family N-acetyltransferase [Streptomyces stramineus]